MNMEQDEDGNTEDYLIPSANIGTMVKSKHQPNLKSNEKISSIKSPSAHHPSVIKQPASGPPYVLISSRGPAADHQGELLGLYRKIEEMREGCSVYLQEQDTEYTDSMGKMFSAQGVWSIEDGEGVVRLRAATPSERPTSVIKWKYKDIHGLRWWDGGGLITVVALSEMPSCDCQVTISLGKDIVSDIKEPRIEGVYTANGSYRLGRPVLQHSGGLFTISVEARRKGVAWYVSSGVGWYLCSGSAPSMCPADPRAARNERLGEKHWSWRYYSRQKGWDYCRPCRGTSLKCNKHLGPGLPPSFDLHST